MPYLRKDESINFKCILLFPPAISNTIISYSCLSCTVLGRQAASHLWVSRQSSNYSKQSLYQMHITSMQMVKAYSQEKNRTS